MILGFCGDSERKLSQGNDVLRFEFGWILIARGRAHDMRHPLIVMEGRGQPSDQWRAECKRTLRALRAEIATNGIADAIAKRVAAVAALILRSRRGCRRGDARRLHFFHDRHPIASFQQLAAGLAAFTFD